MIYSLARKTLATSITALILFGSLISFVPHAQAAGLNISQVQIIPSALSDVASWPETTAITVSDTGDGGVNIDFDKKESSTGWPKQFSDASNPMPGIGIGDAINHTVWIFRNVGGQWYGTGVLQALGNYNDPTGPLANIPCGGLNNVPQMNPGQDFQVGEQIAFMVTAGSERGTIVSDIKERSNIQLYTVTANNLTGRDPACGSGGTNTGPTGPGGPDAGVVPPDLASTGVTALSGKNPSLAFDPVKKLWLVVADNNGKIQGQLMTDNNKPSGTLLNIGGTDAHNPKIAYGANKYLVVWTSGLDPSAKLMGQLVAEDGSSSGSAFSIATGGAHLYGSSIVQYDTINQRFVLAYEKSTSVEVVGINSSGALTGPTQLAQVSAGKSAPALAVNSKTGKYCVTYVDSGKVKIQSLSADGTAGPAGDLGDGQDNVGIIYNLSDGTYTSAWLKDDTIKSQTYNSCAPDPNLTSPAGLASDAQVGVLTQSPGGFGLFIVNLNGTSDHFISFDSAGNQLTDQSIFAGAWDTSAFWLGATLNSATSLYAAVASPDNKTVKFVSGIGTASSKPPNSGAIPKSKDLPVPNQGLPTDLGKLIEAIFAWSLSIIGLVIFVRFFYAGFKWAFLSAGNSAQIGEAKNMMKNAVYGAVVLFSAFLILNTINPDLVHSTFNLVGIPATNPSGGTTPGTNGTSGPAGPNGSTGGTSLPTTYCQNYACSASSPQNAGQGCATESDCGGTDKLCKDAYCTNTGDYCGTSESACNPSSASSGAQGTCTHKDDAGNGICSDSPDKTCTADIDCANDNSVNGSGIAPYCTSIDDAGNGVCSDNPDKTCQEDVDCGG